MDCLDKLIIVRFTEQPMYWKNTYNFISGSTIEKDTNAVQKLVSEKEAFFKDHTSLSLLLFAFFTVGHLIRSIILIIIHSDLWRAYGGIRALPEGYNHLQVNNSVHFVDPDTQACTNHVEIMWKNAKILHKACCGTQRSLLSSYLQEFMWRLRFGKNPFRNIIEHITLRYHLH